MYPQIYSNYFTGNLAYFLHCVSSVRRVRSEIAAKELGFMLKEIAGWNFEKKKRWWRGYRYVSVDSCRNGWTLWIHLTVKSMVKKIAFCCKTIVLQIQYSALILRFEAYLITYFRYTLKFEKVIFNICDFIYINSNNFLSTCSKLLCFNYLFSLLLKR